jgi:hypothetical protein
MNDLVPDATMTGGDNVALDRAEALRRSGLVLLGFFGAAGAATEPATAATIPAATPSPAVSTLHARPFTIADHPICGMGFVSSGFAAFRAGVRPPVPAAYTPCNYIAFVLKNINDKHPGQQRGGIPSEADLDLLHIPIPAGYKAIGAYTIEQTKNPTVSGYDENQQYHGVTPTDPGDAGTPVIGGDGKPYDIFLLIYGT